jgi:hypothetical protein
MQKWLPIRLPAALIVAGVLAAPGVALATAKPAITSIGINPNNHSGTKFTVIVQARRASAVGVCVGVANTTACEYADRQGGTFKAHFHIAGANRSSQIGYFIGASGPGGKRYTMGRLTEGSGVGTTTIG